MTDYSTFPWRVGEEEPRGIYVVTSEGNSIDQPLIGVMDTPRLAFEAVSAHNAKISKTNNMHSYIQKEQMVNDLQQTLELWKKNGGDLEAATIEAFGQSSKAKRVFEAIGFSSSVLGPRADIPTLIQHSIDMIKNS